MIVSRYPRLAMLVLAAVGLGASASACSPAKKQKSRLEDLAFDPEANNVALLFGAPNGLPGVERDLDAMADVLSRSDYGFKFDVRTDASATSADILTGLRDQAAAVGDNGTLLVYFSGHGSSDGRFITVGGSLRFRQIADAVTSSRTTPVKRLIVMNDSCYSGTWTSDEGNFDGQSLALAAGDEVAFADGLAKTSAAAMTDAMIEFRDSRGGVMAEQVLMLAAASKDETASDLGSVNGGAFTYSLRTVLGELSGDQEGSKIKDLVDRTIQRTKSRYGHTPQARALPESMLTERVFGSDEPVQPVTPPEEPEQPEEPAQPEPEQPEQPEEPAQPEPEQPEDPSLPFAVETAHFAQTLVALNAKLDGCRVSLHEMTKGSDLASRYYFTFFAEYADGGRSETASSWGLLTAGAEAEAAEFLKVIPTKYFARCKHKAEPVVDPFKTERAHVEATLAALNAKLSGCEIALLSVDKKVNDKGFYRFTAKATYADGSDAETRSLPGKLAATAAAESGYFLKQIPSRFFKKCSH